MIEVEELTKHYGDVTAVDGITFTVKPGIVTGFLGPNGAGKSTTMRTILGLDRPTSGTATVNGRRFRDAPAPLTELGAMLEAKAVDKGRSARNHLLAIAATIGVGRTRVDEILDMVGLAEVALAASRTRQQDVPTALVYCESAVRRWHAAGAWAPLWITLRTVIVLLMRVGATDDAAVVYGASEAPSDTRVAPYGADARMLRKAAEELQDQLGDEEYARLLDAGRAMASEDAVQFALEALARVSQQ